jgi:hypothetical protein
VKTPLPPAPLVTDSESEAGSQGATGTGSVVFQAPFLDQALIQLSWVRSERLNAWRATHEKKPISIFLKNEIPPYCFELSKKAAQGPLCQ